MRLSARPITAVGAVHAATPHGVRLIQQDPIFHGFDAPLRVRKAPSAAARSPKSRASERRRRGKPDTYRNQSPRRSISSLSSAADGFSLSSLVRESALPRSAKAFGGKLVEMGDN
jgi:hypothetical protein